MNFNVKNAREKLDFRVSVPMTFEEIVALHCLLGATSINDRLQIIAAQDDNDIFKRNELKKVLAHASGLDDRISAVLTDLYNRLSVKLAKELDSSDDRTVNLRKDIITYITKPDTVSLNDSLKARLSPNGIWIEDHFIHKNTLKEILDKF